MAATNNGFEKLIREAVERRLAEIVEEETVTAVERVRRRAKEQMPQILVALHSRFSVEMFGSEMRITVALEDRTANPKTGL